MKEKLASEQVQDGSAWDDFCDALKEAGKLIQSPNTPDDAFNKAEGYRYLTRILRGSLESCIEYADKDFPVLRCICHETIKLGADNPDNYYQSSPINPAYDYRIVGKRGDVPYLSIATSNHQYAKGKGMDPTGFIDLSHFGADADADIEVLLSCTKKDGHWLAMTAETNQVLVRQTHQNRAHEKIAELRIERVGQGINKPEPFSPEKLVKGLSNTAQALLRTTELFEGWAESLVPHENTLPHGDQAFFQMLGGDPNIHYLHSYWSLQEGEVLLLEASVPECETWNFQLDNWWMESLDYVNHTIHKNKFTASYEADGSVKVVVAHTDPGHPNWIDTAGHNNGTMCWRWIGAKENPDVKVTKMALGECQKILQA